WFGYSVTFVVVKPGLEFGTPFTTALRLCAMYTFHEPVMKPAPHGSLGQEPSVGVPYQTMSMRPADPAAIHGKTFVLRPLTCELTLIGLLHVAPPSVEVAR